MIWKESAAQLSTGMLVDPNKNIITKRLWKIKDKMMAVWVPSIMGVEPMWMPQSKQTFWQSTSY